MNFATYTILICDISVMKAGQCLEGYAAEIVRALLVGEEQPGEGSLYFFPARFLHEGYP